MVDFKGNIFVQRKMGHVGINTIKMARKMRMFMELL